MNPLFLGHSHIECKNIVFPRTSFTFPGLEMVPELSTFFWNSHIVINKSKKIWEIYFWLLLSFGWGWNSNFNRSLFFVSVTWQVWQRWSRTTWTTRPIKNEVARLNLCTVWSVHHQWCLGWSIPFLFRLIHTLFTASKVKSF